MPILPRLLLAAAVILAVVGVGVAVGQPGSLGSTDEESAGPAVTTPADAADDVAADPAPAGPAEGADPRNDGTDTMPAPGDPGDDAVAGAGGGAPDPRGGSGLGHGASAPRDLEDGLAATGGTSLLAAAVAMVAAGLALPRRRV